MKTDSRLALAALVAASFGLASPALARPVKAAPKAAPAVPSQYALIGNNYRDVEVLPETFFDPFKIRATSQFPLDKTADVRVTNQTILDAVAQRGVSGILYGPDTKDNRVIIGDQVFGIGDELTFLNEAKGSDAPLVLGATVVLRSVKKENLSFDVTFDGESAHPLEFPLRTFWRP
ncbi:MAG: hypothetical protein ACREFX_08950 [Opitutaceae bacterium]